MERNVREMKNESRESKVEEKETIRDVDNSFDDIAPRQIENVLAEKVLPTQTLMQVRS